MINRIRSGVLVIKRGKILLYQRPKGYWYFPGGGMETGETVEGCAIRETHEETGLKIILQQLLYVRKWKSWNRKGTLELIHLAKPISGNLCKRMDIEERIRTKDVRWFDINEVKNIWFLTPDLIKAFRRDIKNNFKNCPRWLGNVIPQTKSSKA